MPHDVADGHGFELCQRLAAADGEVQVGEHPVEALNKFLAMLLTKVTYE